MSDKKVVFITGASGGIGTAAAERFEKEGWKVVGFSSKDVDVADQESVNKAFDQAFSDLGRIDCLVNCAGIFGFKNLKEYDLETMKKVINVNELGTYLCTKWAAEKMSDGSIVNISSVAGETGSGTDPVYAGTKGAILAFTKSMAKALAPKIRVNAIAPGIVEDKMGEARKWEDVAELLANTLLKKMALPKDIADGIYFLASDQAAHITGICLDINGGYYLR
jgi:3-oxoacyl-[acyl-carrier protein] reductase